MYKVHQSILKRYGKGYIKYQIILDGDVKMQAIK